MRLQRPSTWELLRSVMVFGLLALSPGAVSGQSIGIWSDWDYDEGSGSLYAAAETWADYSSFYYYDVMVIMAIGVTPEGQSQYWTCEVGETTSNAPAQVDCSTTVTGTADLVLLTQHDLYATYEVWQVDPYCYLYGCDGWWDAYETSLLGVNGQQYPTDQFWSAPGPPAVSAPETRTMEAFISRLASIGCGNQEKDSLITEYKDPANRQTWVTVCGDFKNSAGSTHFQFPELTKHNDYSWGIIRSSLLDGLECVRTAGGDQAMLVTSGYRNPASQMRRNPGRPNSRHTRGDAADIGETNTTRRNYMYNTWGPGCDNACVEPLSDTPNHVHFDWRGSCPVGDW